MYYSTQFGAHYERIYKLSDLFQSVGNETQKRGKYGHRLFFLNWERRNMKRKTASFLFLRAICFLYHAEQNTLLVSGAKTYVIKILFASFHPIFPQTRRTPQCSQCRSLTAKILLLMRNFTGFQRFIPTGIFLRSSEILFAV